MDSENIKVKGHIGTWHVIDECNRNGKNYYLLEHDTFGDEAAAVCIREDGKLILEDIWNGFDDVYDFFNENPLLS